MGLKIGLKITHLSLLGVVFVFYLQRSVMSPATSGLFGPPSPQSIIIISVGFNVISSLSE